MDKIVRLPRRTSPFPTEKRSEVRVREPKGSHVEAEVYINDIQGWSGCRVVNLSRHGALIEVPPTKAPLFHQHHKVLVDLRQGKDRLSVGGVIQHRHENRVGIFFSEFVLKQGKNVESILSRMVCSFERTHLRNHALRSWR